MQASEEVVDPVHGLARNALGLPQVLFCIVTGAAPIAAMLFNVHGRCIGGGWAAPSAFIIATFGFTIFSVGYVAMARHVTAAGGFYSFVSHGFGQSLGMGTALLIAACYTVFAAGVTGVTAYFANTTMNDWFGVDIPVWVIEFGTLAVMMVLAFLHIELTARILGVFLVLEVMALLVFGIATLFQRDARARVEALLPGTSSTARRTARKAAFGAGTIGVGFFGAFWSWIGFEMAPNYAEESREPKKIMVPRPTSRSSVSASSTRSSSGCSWSPTARTTSPGRQRADQRRCRLGVLSAHRPAIGAINIGELVLTACSSSRSSPARSRASSRSSTRRRATSSRWAARGSCPASSVGRTPSTTARTSRASLVGVCCALIMAGSSGTTRARSARSSTSARGCR